MNAKTLILAVLVFSVFLVGCTSSGQSSYSTYNQPQQQGQPQGGQYVGGGCGVAPSGSYENTPIEAVKPADSNL